MTEKKQSLEEMLVVDLYFHEKHTEMVEYIDKPYRQSMEIAYRVSKVCSVLLNQLVVKPIYKLFNIDSNIVFSNTIKWVFKLILYV